MGPDEVVDAWIARLREGDFPGAGALVAENAPIHAQGLPEPAELVGWDDYLSWYARRRVALAVASWHVLSRSSGEHHVTTLVRMRAAAEPWYALTVYRVADDLIQEMWLHEPF